MKKNFFRFLFSFFIIFLTGFNSYSQNWANNLHSQQLSKGDLDFYDYQNAFYQDYPKDIVKDGYKLVNNQNEKIPYWKLFKRWEWQMESRVDKQTGNFPIKSASQVLQEFNQQGSQIQSQPINGGGSWSNTGPSSNYSGYSGTGRLNCVTFHPSDINTFWVGSPSGGVWKTTNGGTNWFALTDDNDVLGVSTIALHPNYTTNQTLFIGTGDRDGGSMWTLGGGQSNDNNGIGILKSTDDGNTWTSTGLTFTTNQKVSVNEILINQNNASIMIAATSQGIYKSSDGGVSWALKSNSLEFVDIDFKPGSFSTMYASTSSWSNSKIYKSTDSGENWTEVLSVSGRRIQLAVSPNNASIVYALAANDNRGLEGVYKSTNSGSTFSKIFNGTNTTGLLDYYCDGSGSNEGQGSYDLCLAADPNNADIVFLGGVNTWKSTDGGSSWTNNNMWTSSSTYNSCNSPVVHADKHYLIFQNGTSTLFECNDGGIYKSSNSGASWTDLTGNMKTSQMYRISASASSSTEILCGLQDNGTKRFNSNNWSDVSGGDGMECLIDYSNSNTQYSGVQNGKIYRTTNGWSSKTNISDNVPGGQDGAWVSPYIIDPVNNQTLYLGYSEVYKTTDKGDNWTQISNLSVPGKIRSMAIAKSNNQYLYIANHDNIWKTTNGGTSWADITGSLPTGSNNITYIAIKNNDPNTVWVTFGGYNSLKVYQTINGGSSWTNISAGLPSIPTMSIVQNKQNTTENELYVGTDVGVYQKIGNNNWTPYCTGLPNVVVTELEIYYDANNSDNSKLWAGTFGRGLWSSPLPSLFSTQNPSNLVASAISNSQIDLSWNLNANGDNILLAVSSSSSFGTPIDGNSYSVGDNIIGGGQVIGVGNITSLNDIGLSANTTYYYKIWSNDGTSYSSGLNANATTLCGITTTFPINEGFEGAAIPNCWTTFRGVNNQGVSNDWSIVSSSSNTGVYSAYVKYEDVPNSAEDWMVSPLLDLTNVISASVSYWERDSYSGDWGTIYKLKVSTNSQTNHSDFIDLVSYSESDMSNAWTQNTVDLSAYVGQQVYVAFVMTQDNGDDWYLDDIQFSRVQGATVVADFSASDSTFCLGTSVTFTDLSTGNPTSWSWDFGDGNTSSLQNPSHTYVSAGTYDVSLTVTTSTGSDSETKNGFITVNSNPNINAGIDQSICDGISTTLNATSGQNYVTGVTAAGASDYILSGAFSGNDPDINISLGDTLTFNVNSPGHPFLIKTTNTTGTANAVTVTNNGTSSGTIIWSPASSGTYYYICEYHAGMVGTITVGASNVNYTWNNNITDGTGFTPTSTNTYTVTGTDGNGCTSTDNVIVTVLSDNTAGAGSATPTLCENTSLLNITHATSGATGIVDDGVAAANGLPGGVSASWAADEITISGTPTASGTFNYTIPLAGGCGTVSASGTIIVNSQLDWANLQSPSSGSMACGGTFDIYGQVYEPGLTDADANAAGIGLTVEFGFSASDTDPSTWTNWSAATYNTDVGNNDEFKGTFSGLSSGTYYYTFRNKYGECDYIYGGYNGGFWDGTNNINGLLTVTPEDATFTYSANSYCKEVSNPTPTVSGILGGSFTSSPSGLSINSTSGAIDLSASTAGAYTVTYNTPNCNSTSSQTVTIFDTPIADAGSDISICNGNSSLLSANGGSSYVWSPTTGLSNPNIANPTATPTSTTIYSVTVTDGNGCFSTDNVTVNLISSSTGTDVISSCDSITWIDGNTYNSNNNTATHTLTNAAGCDSVVTLNLTISSGFLSEETLSACDSLVWSVDGNTYTQSGIYYDSLQSSNGCDSVYKLDLTITQSSNTTDFLTQCDSLTWIDGITYTASNNTATFTLTNAAGCDSLVTLNLTVNYSSTSLVTESSCSSYSWNGQTLSASGIYVDTNVNAAGCPQYDSLDLTITTAPNASNEVACDSFAWNGNSYTTSGTYTSLGTCVDTLNLVINNSSSSTSSLSSCGDISWNGSTYTATGIYNFITTNSVGCDSTATLDLTIDSTVVSQVNVTACDSYSWNNNTYSVSGNYTDTLSTIAGCDSIIILDLTINSIYTGDTTTLDACDSAVWSALTYESSGVYVDTLQTITGCDSLVTLNLTVNYSSSSLVTQSYCNNYSWNGQTLSASGIYVDTNVNTAGCPQYDSLDLTITTTPNTSNEVACDSFAWNGNSYTSSGTYTSLGTCVDTLNLVINNSSSSTSSLSSCGDILWNGSTYTTTGIYNFITTNSVGCDSTATLDLTIDSAVVSQVNVTACDSYSWNNSTYSASGNYTDTISTSAGCDSIVTLNLTIDSSFNNTLNEAACDSYSWNGIAYTIGGTYYDSLQTSNGCDSVITLNLTINNSHSTVDSITACSSYLWNGTSYTQSGTYYDSLQTVTGCDSIVTLNLKVNNSFSSVDTISSCNNYSWNGNTYSQSGTYVDTLQTISGCDSIASLQLSILESYIIEDSISACGSYLWNGVLINSSGTYTDSLQSIAGCDSINVLYLDVNDNTAAPLTLELLLDDYCLETFWAVKDSQDSIWYSEGPYDCNPSGGGNQANTTIIKDIYLEENECYTFELNDVYGDGLSASLWNGTDGNWTLQDLNGNIVSQGQGDFGFITANSFNVSQSTPSFINEENSKLEVLVYPNPFSKTTTIKIINGKGPYLIELFDIRGGVVKSLSSNQEEFQLDDINASSGIYWLKIKNQSNLKPIKLVIE